MTTFFSNINCGVHCSELVAQATDLSAQVQNDFVGLIVVPVLLFFGFPSLEQAAFAFQLFKLLFHVRQMLFL